MTRSKGKKLPGFRSRAEIVSFFESHDLGDYADQLPEAKLDFAITRRTLLVPIDEHLMDLQTLLVG